MSNIAMIKEVIREYGLKWLINRIQYSAKLKIMSRIPMIDRFCEKNTPYPEKIDLFQIDVQALSHFLEGLGDIEKNQLIVDADKACKGIIRGFSSVELDYGYPIDWQLNPLTSMRCDEEKKWYKIPDFDMNRGDIKVVWEVSRFSHFITLARAYVVTRDERYYMAFSEQLNSWLNNNAYGYGANFKCGQESALRMVNVLMAYTIFTYYGLTTDTDVSHVKDFIDRSYRKILSNFFYAYKCVKNNHTISEIMGIIIGAWCCEDDKRLGKAFKLLDKVIDEQFTKSGGYKQFSFNYQRLVLQDLECVLSLETRVGKTLSNESKKKIKKAAMLMFQCQDESGDVPNYGSNDGALVFPVTSCGYRDFRPVINSVCALLGGGQLYEKGSYQEELIWFSGGKNIDGFKYESIDRVSSQFDDAGIFTIRNEKSWAMIIANDYCSRPAHMDQLHFDLWVRGVNVLCDCGTYSYASELGKKLMRNESHNTAVVEGRAQMNARGPFMIYGWPKRELGRCDGSAFDGRIRSKNGYTHRRIVNNSNRTYEIVDNIDVKGSIVFYTPCDVEVRNEEVLLVHKGETMIRIRSNAQISVRKEVRSLYYLNKEEINCIVLKTYDEIEYITTIEIEDGEKKND